MRLARCAAAALLALCLPSSSPANNPCGLMTLTGGGDSAGMLLHFQLARKLVGK
jgi:hypothetical protein